jgi:hypothetical protein
MSVVLLIFKDECTQAEMKNLIESIFTSFKRQESHDHESITTIHGTISISPHFHSTMLACLCWLDVKIASESCCQ